jgi:hypothetical protein
MKVPEDDRYPARTGWLSDLERLRPEILRDPVAHAMVHRARAVFAEMGGEASRLLAENAALRRMLAENAALRRNIAELQGHRVFIVPGEKYLEEALASVGDARDGDRVQVPQADIELVRNNGHWEPVVL